MRKLLTILCFAFLTFSMSAQEVWPLERCVARAQEQSLNVKNGIVQIEQAAINETQAKHARYPNLNGSTGFGRSYGRRIDPSTNEFIDVNFNFNSWSFSSGLTLFNAGILTNEIKRTKMLTEAAHQDAQQAEQNIALDVATAYLNVIFQDENVKNAQTQYDISRQQIDRMQKLIDAGVNPASDILEIEAQLARDEQALIAANNSLASGYLQLKQLMFMEPGENIVIDKPNINQLLIDQSGTLSATFAEVYEKALSTQPNITAGDLREKAAELTQLNSERSIWPSLTLGGSVGSNWSSLGQRFNLTNEIESFDTPVEISGIPAVLTTYSPVFTSEDNPFFDQHKENLGYGFNLSLSIPLYNNYATQANITRSKLSLASTRLQNESVKQSLKTNVQRAIADARAASKNLEAAEKSLTASQAAFDNVQKRLNAGTANNFDFTTAKNNLAAVEVNKLVAQYDFVFKLKVVDYYLGRPITLK